MILPSLSVILPNYNHGHYLPVCLEAMLSQSFSASEIIIVDDASTDNSVEVIEGFARQNPTIRLVRNEQNLGAMPSFLKGLSLSTGDYFLSASADDFVLPGLFEKSIKLLSKYPQAGLCSAISRRIDESGNYLDSVPEPPYLSSTPCYISPEKALNALTRQDNWCIMPSTAIWSKSAVIESKAFPKEAGNFMDGFAMVLISLNYGACFIPEELGVFRLMENSLTAKEREDPESCLELFRPMDELMETTYADKFPIEYKNDFRRRNFYQRGALAVYQLKKSQLNFMKNLELSLGTNFLADRLFFSGTRIFFRVQNILTKLYLFLRLRRLNRSIILRVVYRLKNRYIKSGVGNKSHLK